MTPFEYSISLIFTLMISSCCHGSKILLFHQQQNIQIIAEALASNGTLILHDWHTVVQEILDDVCSSPRPHLVLDMTTFDIASETTKKLTKFAHISTITTSYGGDGDFVEWMELSNAHKNIFLQIKQPADLVPHIVRAIVELQRYPNAGIIYDNTFLMLHKLKMLLLNMEVRHSIVEYKAGIPTALNKLELFNFFIIGTEQTISKVLTEACKNMLTEINFSWYAITLDEFDKIEVDCPTMKYVVASPKPSKSNINFDFKDNTLPRLTREFFHDVIKIGLEIHSSIKPSNLKTLCDDGSNESIDGKKIIPLVNSVLQRNSQKPFLFHKYIINNDFYNSFVYVEMQLNGYRINETGKYKEHVGDWSSDHITSLKNAGNMEKYASMIIYRIAIAIQEPFLFPDPNSKYNYSGYCIDLIEEIGIKVGFKFELYRPKGSGFRYDFNAAIREVSEGKADIALGSISVRPSMSGVEFTIPFYELVGMLIMMKIPESSKSFFKIIEVLDIGVWGVLLLLYFLTSLFIWLYDKYSPYSYQNNKESLKDSSDTREFTVKECLWFSLTSLTSQGGGEAPRPFSAKIIAGLWWLFGFLIIASYTANLAAFLTASHLESSIESLDDLSKQYRVKYSIINGSSGQRYFETLSVVEDKLYNYWVDFKDTKVLTLDYTIDKMYSKMLKFMIDSKVIPNDLEEAIAKVQASTPSNSYAYIGDATDIKFAVLTHCDLQAVGEEFAKKFYSLVVKTSSPLKEPLDAALMDLLNERKLERMRNKWWRENPKIVQCSTQTEGITIQNVVGVFLLIGGGVIVSLIIMALENAYEKRKLKLQSSVTSQPIVFNVSAKPQ